MYDLMHKAFSTPWQCHNGKWATKYIYCHSLSFWGAVAALLNARESCCLSLCLFFRIAEQILMKFSIRKFYWYLSSYLNLYLGRSQFTNKFAWRHTCISARISSETISYTWLSKAIMGTEGNYNMEWKYSNRMLFSTRLSWRLILVD
jgi:hypothetical protein